MDLSIIDSTIQLFKYYKHLGDQSMIQLSDEELFSKNTEGDNSVAIIVKHLWGNMMSRWTDIWNTDGEKDWRNRETEFDNDINSRQELHNKWEEGWKCLFGALDTITEDNINDLIYIRNIGHTPMEAVHRQLGHYAYHIGQIVYISKSLKKEEWKSLSIAKGESSTYNQKKFNQEKTKGHFTNEFLK